MSAELPPLIALEEHYLSKEFLASDAYPEIYGQRVAHGSALSQQIGDLSDCRIENMTVNGISLQILSHAPGLHSLEQCRIANDGLSAAVQAHPDRYAAFAVLPVKDPQGCAHELRRCVLDMGFKGALIDNHTVDGKYFTGEAYDAMWQTFQDLDVPCYIHPTWPTKQQMDADFNDQNMPPGAVFHLSTSTWGWHSDVASHIIKLLAAEVFDRFPRLKIILGHFGEMIPFMLDRIDLFCRRWKKTGRMFKEMWSENIWITTSGVWSIDPLATVLRNTSIDRILFSIDYPFAPNENGRRWMQDLMASGMVDEDGIRKIAFENSKALFGVKA